MIFSTQSAPTLRKQINAGPEHPTTRTPQLHTVGYIHTPRHSHDRRREHRLSPAWPEAIEQRCAKQKVVKTNRNPEVIRAIMVQSSPYLRQTKGCQNGCRLWAIGNKAAIWSKGAQDNACAGQCITCRVHAAWPL